MPKVSVIIASYNMGHLVLGTIKIFIAQTGVEKENIVYDDCSTDNTEEAVTRIKTVKYVRGEKNLGVGDAFNAGMKLATGQYVILMCADDLLVSRHVLSDMTKIMEEKPTVGYVTRWYYQFINDDIWSPVRAWRGNNPILLANNPSGLMFRAEALEGKRCSNAMFVETSFLAASVKQSGWETAILPYDAVAVRVHDSTSREKEYWLKHRVSSPVLDWTAIGCPEIAQDYVSFIQIKNGFTMDAVWEEIVNFAKVRPLNLLNPKYYFWATVALVTPRRVLRKLPPFYRKYIGQGLTEIKKRRM